MTNSVNNQETFQEELQSYIQNMDQELSAAEALLQAMGNANSQEAPYLSIMNQQALWVEVAELLLGGDNGPLTDTEFHAMYPNLYPTYFAARSKVDALQDVIAKDTAQLEAIDPNVTSTLTALQQLNEQAENLLHDGLRSSDLDKSFQQISTIFRQLCSVILNEIQTDLAMAGMKKFGSGPNGGSAILQFAGIAIQAEFQEQTNLQGIQNGVINDLVGWQQEKSDAQADLDTSHWYDFFTGGGPDSSKDEAKIRAANAMISILTDVETVVSSMITVIDPGMQEFQYELQNLKAQFDKILAGHGTIQQVKDAMIEALSILVAIIAETQNDSSTYDKEMNQASMASSQMHLNDSLAQQEVIDDAQKYASIMGKLLGAAKYIGLGVIFLLNPGIAMAIMVALQAALTASGEMDKLQNALSSTKLGDAGGAAVTCGIEMIVTVGGAAGIDALIQKAAAAAAASVMEEGAEEAEAAGDQEAEKAVAAAVTEGVAKAMEDVIETTTQAAVKTIQDAAVAVDEDGGIEAEAAIAGVQNVSAESVAAAREVVEKAVTQAVEAAQKKVTLAFMSKTVTETITSFIRGDLKMAMATAMKQAAENAGKEVQVLAETAAKQASAGVIGDVEIDSIAQTSANRAVADVMKITEESAAKLNKMTLLGERTAAKKAVVRGLFTGMSAMGSTGLPADLTAQMKGQKEKDLSQGWQIAMEVIQALMQLIGTIGASDIGAQSIPSQGLISKVTLGAQVAQSGMDAIGTAGEAEAEFMQAHAVKAIAKDQSVLDMMQFVMSQLAKDGQLQRDAYSKEMQIASRSNMKLAMHFTDADQEVAQAQSVLAV